MPHLLPLALVVFLFLSLGAACASTAPAAPDVPEPALIGTAWSVVAVESERVPTDADVSLRLSADGRAGGGAGVNRWFASFSRGDQLGGDDGALVFSAIGATRMAGSPERMELERRFLGALERVDRARVRDGRLELLSGDEPLVELRPATRAAADASASSG